MQPQQPYSASPSAYEFITNPQKPKRGLDVGSMKQRLILVGLGLLVLIIVSTVLINLLKGNDKSLPSLITVAQRQQALIHLTDGSTSKVGISGVNNTAAVTVNLSVATEQKDLFAYFKINAYKLSTAQLNARVSPKVDAQLETATAAGEFNTVFGKLLKSELEAYKQSLQQAYTNVKGTKGRALLQQDFKEVELMQKQLASNGS